MKARKPDKCAVCGQAIQPGTVFVAKRVSYEGGAVRWLTVHLLCNARLRGGQADRLRELAAPVPAGYPIGDCIALPVGK